MLAEMFNETLEVSIFGLISVAIAVVVFNGGLDHHLRGETVETARRVD